jgi:hypothetical protein
MSSSLSLRLPLPQSVDDATGLGQLNADVFHVGLARRATTGLMTEGVSCWTGHVGRACLRRPIADA